MGALGVAAHRSRVLRGRSCDGRCQAVTIGHASKPRQTPVNHAHYEGYIRLCPKSIFVVAHAHARAKYGTKSNRPLVFVVTILNRSRNYLFFNGSCLG